MAQSLPLYNNIVTLLCGDKQVGVFSVQNKACRRVQPGDAAAFTHKELVTVKVQQGSSLGLYFLVRLAL